MGSFQREIVIVSLVFIFCTVLVHADWIITVTNSSCGGQINLVKGTKLRLNYYGAEIGDPGKSEMVYQKDKTCLYNISSAGTHEMETCVLLILHENMSPWDIACTTSLQVYIGMYHNVHIPSRYRCSNLKPLCTSEKDVFLQFQYKKALRLMNRKVNVELDVYLKDKIVTTTTDRSTTVTPLDTKENESSFPSTEIIIVIAVVAVVATCCLCYICCCSKEETPPSPPQNVNDPSNDECTENNRMLQAPVVHPPPENMSGAAGDPPDYYSLCQQGIATDKSANVMYYKYAGNEEEKVIPSAPPPPYPGF